MPRPKSAKHADLLDRAMLLFWRQGFHATSMRDLEQHTRLSAGSLYHEFGSKKQLFQKALEHYLNRIIQYRIDTYLHNPAGDIDGIGRFVVSMFYDLPEDYSQQSCLLVNSALELDPSDPETGPVIQAGMEMIQSALEYAIREAINQGHLASSIQAKASAQHIALLLPGILIAARNGSPPERLRFTVQSCLESILKPEKNNIPGETST